MHNLSPQPRLQFVRYEERFTVAEVKDPLDRLDELVATIAAKQARILEVLAASVAAHQAVDAEHAPILNLLYRDVWAAFQEIQGIAEAHPEMVPRGKRSAQRSTGTVGWRANAEIVMHVDLSELIRRIKAMGPTISRKLLRRVVNWELRAGNVKAPENAELVAGVDGLEVRRFSDFYVDPKNGIRLSTAAPWWPTLEGLTSSKVFRVLFPSEDI